MAGGACPKCSTIPFAFERFCAECGYDLHPGRPVAPGTEQKARERREAWVPPSRRRNVVRPPAPAAAKPAPKPAPEPPAPPPATGGPAPVPELIYWTQCSRVLADLQRVAQANADRLRRECLVSGLTGDELELKVQAGLTPVAGTLPAEVPAPADWYPDPAGSDQRRYWNGVAWTQQLS